MLLFRTSRSRWLAALKDSDARNFGIEKDVEDMEEFWLEVRRNNLNSERERQWRHYKVRGGAGS